MNVWKHCLLSTKKFGGVPEDYFSIHDFIDSSKLFIFHAKHRAMLHNLYGIELCISLFGHYIVNTDNKTILVRDIAAEHCKEDLSGFIPTLNDWFIDFELPNDFIIPNIEDSQLKEFLFKPLLRSSCKSSMIITCSNFGVYLVEKIYGLEKALLLAQYISPQQTINHLLKDFRLIHKWQIFPSKIDLVWLQEQENERN